MRLRATRLTAIAHPARGLRLTDPHPDDNLLLEAGDLLLLETGDALILEA